MEPKKIEELESLVELETDKGNYEKLIVMLSEDNCGFCSMLEFGIGSYIDTLELDIHSLNLNIDQAKEDSKEIKTYFDIDTVPVLLGYKEGELVSKKEVKEPREGINKMDALVKDLGIELG